MLHGACTRGCSIYPTLRLRGAHVRQARLQLGVSMEGGASSEGFTTATGPTPSNQGYTASTDRSVTAPAPAPTHAPAAAPAAAPATAGLQCQSVVARATAANGSAGGLSYTSVEAFCLNQVGSFVQPGSALRPAPGLAATMPHRAAPCTECVATENYGDGSSYAAHPAAKPARRLLLSQSECCSSAKGVITTYEHKLGRRRDRPTPASTKPLPQSLENTKRVRVML